jgi:hypothetical protein
MRKIIISTISIVLSSMIFNACSTTSINTEDAKTASFTHLEHEMPLAKVHKLILKAGEENGWRMTEFKENKLIAEKQEDGTMKAVTITFTKDYFDISPKDNDLHEAIEKELEN